MLVLDLAMKGLLVESLTLPGVLGDATVAEATELIVRTIVSER